MRLLTPLIMPWQRPPSRAYDRALIKPSAFPRHLPESRWISYICPSDAAFFPRRFLLAIFDQLLGQQHVRRTASAKNAWTWRMMVSRGHSTIPDSEGSRTTDISHSFHRMNSRRRSRFASSHLRSAVTTGKRRDIARPRQAQSA